MCFNQQNRFFFCVCLHKSRWICYNSVLCSMSKTLCCTLTHYSVYWILCYSLIHYPVYGRVCNWMHYPRYWRFCNSCVTLCNVLCTGDCVEGRALCCASGTLEYGTIIHLLVWFHLNYFYQVTLTKLFTTFLTRCGSIFHKTIFFTVFNGTR